MSFKEVRPADLKDNYFRRISEDWMLIGAEKEGKVNMMTASWGGTGIYWGKPVAYIYIRPQRHTKRFVDTAKSFSLTFFPEEYREQLNFCGSKSGRDHDKVAECGFTVLREGGIPYFEQADTALICETLISTDLKADSFVNADVIASAYPNKDFHTLYVAEIVKALVKE